MKRILIPYFGIDELRFGATPDEARQRFGEPLRVSTNRSGEKKVAYEEVELTFGAASGTLVEMAFRPKTELLVGGIDVLNDEAALQKLIALDQPLEYVAILFFPRLGISVTGLHNEGDKCLTAIGAGRFDSVKHQFTSWPST